MENPNEWNSFPNQMDLDSTLEGNDLDINEINDYCKFFHT